MDIYIYSYKKKKKIDTYLCAMENQSMILSLIFSRFQTLEDEHLVGKVTIFKPQINKVKSDQTTSG